jgi:hypothetical protein
MLESLPLLPGTAVQGPEAELAATVMWPHPEVLRHGHCSTIRPFRPFDSRRLPLRRDVRQ